MRGRWSFDPAKRVPNGQRELVCKGTAPPEDGDYCIAEVAWDGPARLIEVLGADDRPEWDDRAVASQHRLRIHFAEDVQREAAGFGEPGARERTGRLDLRDQLSLTIDPRDARDHDDALSITAREGGTFEIGVHIADVSHYVQPGSALDLEAAERGASCYLPGGVIPMLPPSLSADLCSLREERDRLALSVIAELDANGVLHGYRFAETMIRVRARLSYEQVEAALHAGVSLPPGIQSAVRSLMTLARKLRARRFEVGALAIESPEVRAECDARGAPIAIRRSEHLESHELVEEFMLLANRCVGEAGAVRGAGMLWRVHEPPLATKLVQLDDMLRALGLPRPGRLDQPAKALQSVLAVPLDPARRRLVHRLVLRSLTRARYLDRDLGHFGLATREYCHFTSPIRRYPDLHNHRRVREWIVGRPDGAWDPLANAELAERCTANEQSATDAERDAVRLKGVRWLEGRLGDRASGSISGLTPRGFFVELDETPVDGFVRLTDQFDERFDLDPAGVRLVSRRTRRRFTLGDAVEIVVARVDIPARECDFALQMGERRRGPRSRGRQGWR